MEFERYIINNYPGKDDLYWFISKSRERQIIKIVVLQKIQSENRYNLALGDFIEGEVQYANVSDNKDTKKVLVSIAMVVQDYTRKYPEREIFIIGDSPAKTRLYQIQISNNIEEIQKEFYVWAQAEIGMQFEDFKKGKNYVGFLVKRK